MMEFPEKISFNETLALYEGRKTDIAQPDIEKLNFDKEAVQDRMDEFARKLLKSYKTVGLNSKGVIVDRPEVWKKRIPLLAEVVDDTIPLTLFVMKTFSHDLHSEKEDETISFDLVKGRVEGNTTDDIYKALKSSFSSGNHISDLEFIDNGNLFDLADRFTNLKFREQGFASMLLQTSENFIQENSNENQKTSTSFVDVAQLDVVCWLYNKGYRPQTDEDAQQLSEVLAGDSGIVIGKNYYIFKNIPKESQIVKLPDGTTVPNRHNAYRIKFVKEIPPKNSSSVVDIRKRTRSNIPVISRRNGNFS